VYLFLPCATDHPRISGPLNNAAEPLNNATALILNNAADQWNP
jgi:hypothetical protein